MIVLEMINISDTDTGRANAHAKKKLRHAVIADGERYSGVFTVPCSMDSPVLP